MLPGLMSEAQMRDLNKYLRLNIQGLLGWIACWPPA
jgi:hypothetical protein